MICSTGVFLSFFAFGVLAKQKPRPEIGGHVRRLFGDETSVPYVPWDSFMTASTGTTPADTTVSVDLGSSVSSASASSPFITGGDIPTCCMTCETPCPTSVQTSIGGASSLASNVTILSPIGSTTPALITAPSSPTTPSTGSSTNSSSANEITLGVLSSTSTLANTIALNLTSTDSTVDTTPLPWGIWSTATGDVDTLSLPAEATNAPFPNSTISGPDQTSTDSSITSISNGTIILTTTRMITVTATGSVTGIPSASVTNVTKTGAQTNSSRASVTIGSTIGSIPLWLNNTNTTPCTLSANTTTTYSATIVATTLSNAKSTFQTNATAIVLTGAGSASLANATFPSSSVFWPNATWAPWTASANTSSTNSVSDIITTLPFESTTIFLTIPISFASGLSHLSTSNYTSAIPTLSGSASFMNATSATLSMTSADSTDTPTFITLTDGLTAPLTITATTIQPNATTVTASLITSACTTAIISSASGSALDTPLTVLDCVYRACAGTSCFVRETLVSPALGTSSSKPVDSILILTSGATDTTSASFTVVTSRQSSAETLSSATISTDVGTNTTTSPSWTTSLSTTSTSDDLPPSTPTTINICVHSLSTNTFPCPSDLSSIPASPSQFTSSSTWLPMTTDSIGVSSTLISSSLSLTSSPAGVTVNKTVTVISTSATTSLSASNIADTTLTTRILSSFSSSSLLDATTVSTDTFSTSSLLWSPYGFIPPSPSPSSSPSPLPPLSAQASPRTKPILPRKRWVVPEKAEVDMHMANEIEEPNSEENDGREYRGTDSNSKNNNVGRNGGWRWR